MLDRPSQFNRDLVELVARPMGGSRPDAERRVREVLQAMQKSADALHSTAQKNAGRRGRPSMRYEEANV